MAAKQARDASGEKTDQPVNRTEFSDDQRASSSAPRAVQRPATANPGPDVSNADIDLAAVSLDAGDSTYHDNPDPNPNDLYPAPGPSTVQVLGQPSGGEISQPAEEARSDA
jgi:hypothetical protein